MPNHITNRITALGAPEDIQVMLEQIQDRELGLGSVDFNQVVPMPKELDMESSSRTRQGLNLYLNFIQVYLLGRTPQEAREALREIPRRSEEAFLNHRQDVDAETWALGKQAWKNVERYGAPTWYEWAVQNWGTKWNAYSQDNPQRPEGGEAHLYFQTAWDPPEPILERLAQQYPQVELIHEWADEDIGHNCGRCIYRDGILQERYLPQSDLEGIQFAAEVMETDPADWGLYLNAAEDGYIEGWDSNYQLVEVQDQMGLFTPDRLDAGKIPMELFCYELQGKNGSFSLSAAPVTEEFAGTLLLRQEVPMDPLGRSPLPAGTDFQLQSHETVSLAQFMLHRYEPVAEAQYGPVL